MSSSISNLCDSTASCNLSVSSTSAEEIMAVLLHTPPSETAVRQICGRAGLHAVTAALGSRMDDANPDDVRDSACNALAVLASVVGIPILLPFLERTVDRSRAAAVVEKIAAVVVPNAVAPHMKPLVDLVLPGLTHEETGLTHEENERVRVIASWSLASLAQIATAAPNSAVSAFDRSTKPVLMNMMDYRGELRAYSATALRAMLPLMHPVMADYLTVEVLYYVPELLGSQDPKIEEIALDSIKHCLKRFGTQQPDRMAVHRFFDRLHYLFERMWASKLKHHPVNYQRIVETTAELVNLFCLESFTDAIPEMLPGESQEYITTVIRTVEKVNAWGFSRYDEEPPHYLLQELIHDVKLLFSS